MQWLTRYPTVRDRKFRLDFNKNRQVPANKQPSSGYVRDVGEQVAKFNSHFLSEKVTSESTEPLLSS